MNLRPTGKTGGNQMAHPVLRNFTFIDLRDFRKFRPRTDERKVTRKYVPQLRQFINTCLSKKAAERRHTVLLLQFWITLIVEQHGTQFNDAECATPLANAFIQ